MAHDTGDVDVYPGTLQPVFGDLKQEKIIAQPQSVENALYNATINWDLGFASLTSSTSYTESKPDLTEDFTWVYGSYVSSLLGGTMAPRSPSRSRFIPSLRSSGLRGEETRNGTG